MLETIENDQYMKRPDVVVGDTVKLHMKIKEGDKERIQVFEGIVIAIKGRGMSKTLTVRKISFGVGVERIVPIHSPMLEKLEVVKRGSVRRSKLYYMRQRVGKSAMKISNSQFVASSDDSDDEELTAEDSVEEESKDKKNDDDVENSQIEEANDGADEVTEDDPENDEKDSEPEESESNEEGESNNEGDNKPTDNE